MSVTTRNMGGTPTDLKLVCQRVSHRSDLNCPKLSLSLKFMESVVPSHDGGTIACNNEGRCMTAAIDNTFSQLHNFQDTLEKCGELS